MGFNKVGGANADEPLTFGVFSDASGGSSPSLTSIVSRHAGRMNPIIEQLESFDKLQLEVLEVHAAIHRRLFQVLSRRLNCERKELPKLTFMHAARLAYAGQNQADLIDLLQKLDAARNELAHENNPTKFNDKFAAMSQTALGSEYVENLSPLEMQRKQDSAALRYIKVLIESTHVG